VGFVSGQTAALQAAISDYAIEHGMGDKVSVSEIDEGISIKITTDDILFAPGRARLIDTGLLERVAESLRGSTGILEIRGHTDDQNPDGALYADNFELSVARAMAVVGFMREAGIDEARLRVAGAAAYEPIVPNDTDANRAKNRYVEIRLRETGQDAAVPTEAPAAIPTLTPIIGDQP
jgi:flagellar motor protein MotB